MIRYKSPGQLSVSEFTMPFEKKPEGNNRRVILSDIVPWEEFAELCHKNFKSNSGRPKKDVGFLAGIIIINIS